MSTGYTLLTGATGFIGSHVAEKLLRDRTWPVIAIVRGGRCYKNIAQLEREGTILVQGRFYDPDLLERIFRRFPIRNVIHIAALTGDGKGNEKDYERINVCGTENILAISHRYQVNRFIQCSSVGVFGAIPLDAPASLNTRLNPDSTYHRSKLAGEKKVEEFIRKGLNAFIIRPTIVYGLRDTGFPFILTKLVKRKLLLLPFKRNRIHLLSASSLAGIFLRVLKMNDLSNRVFIVADEDPVALRDLVNWIHSFYFGREYPRFLKMPNTVFGVFETIFRMARCTRWIGRIERLSKDWFFDARKTNALIGFRPDNTHQEFLRYLDSLT